MLLMLNNTSKVFIRQSCLKRIISFHKRGKHRQDHWSVISKKKFPKDRALEHYDDFYKTVFGKKWPSIRTALLAPHKYCAIVNNYSDKEEIIANLESQGAMNLRALFEVERKRLKEIHGIPSNERNAEKVINLDKKLSMLMHSKQQAELDSIYPLNEEGNVNRPQVAEPEKTAKISDLELARRSKESLSKSLSEAEFDEHRLIDAAGGLSAAGMYEFIPATKLKGMEDWVLESEHYSYYKRDADFPVIIKDETELHFPEHLDVYTFEEGNHSPFPSPTRGSTGVLSYYLLDGSSILPVLALGLEPRDTVLDMCAAPGGKSLAMLQTLYPESVVCNDIQESRTNRIHSVMKQFFYDLDKRSKEIVVTQGDARNISDQNYFNKILVDVPCTTDRHSALENDNNIFKPTRKKERLKLPEVQADILTSALKLVKPGGTVVYSTCSLSPIQNDGVVHMALRKVWEDTSIKLEVRDLTAALEQTRLVFKIGKDVGLKYGHLVLPHMSNNFGPMYFCKIVRMH